MNQFFGYIRVSTVKQGQQGVSLQEQRDSILHYASRNGWNIISWFEEQETAAKRGRPVFNKMLKLLRQAKADGVILHKIDRGARNLKDWADMADLIDAGIQVHFANESLDMHSRGGRLSADIQAVVAADYIRNLREETRKGFYGRLKQGVYPLPAPIGYVDKGKGKAKEPDPIKAPLVRKAFELYATGRYNLDGMGQELGRLGLRNRHGGTVTRNGLSVLLKNVFYIGLMSIKQTGEVYSGAHTPLVAKSLFDRVQLVLSGKLRSRGYRHQFLFGRLLRCRRCGHILTGERQKGHHYYRCHSKDCPVTCVREETVDAEIQSALVQLRFSEEELSFFRTKITELKASWGNQEEDEKNVLTLRMGQLRDRLHRLTDAFLDGAIERSLFDERKSALLMEQKGIEEDQVRLSEKRRSFPDQLAEYFELAGRAWLSYKMGIPEEKRDLLKTLTSNLEVDGKNVAVKLSIPFSEVANRPVVTEGDPQRDRLRTWRHLLDILTAAYTRGQLPMFKHTSNCDEDDTSAEDGRKEGNLARFGKKCT